jgi:hypothetical protein
MYIGHEYTQNGKANQSRFTVPKARAANFANQGSVWKMISRSSFLFTGSLARHKSPTVSIDGRMTQMWQLLQQSAILSPFVSKFGS